MSRILLVDDSPHAQRMGERILSEEGHEVVTVSNADSALIRLDDVDPDVVLADVVMPGRTGYEICQYLKMSPRHRHVRVILTAGVLETLNDAEVAKVEADATLRKPFEASALVAAVKPLAEAAERDRAAMLPREGGAQALAAPKAIVPFVTVVDEEQVRAAVTVALDASMATMAEEIARRVLAALASRKPEAPLESTVPAPAPQQPPQAVSPAAGAAPAAVGPAAAPYAADSPFAPGGPFAPPEPLPETAAPAGPPRFAQPAPAMPAPPPPPIAPRVEPVRRVSAVRHRAGSVLGLDISRPEEDSFDADRE
jgi:CheY-like chemotaxis protein